ncbi:hypothetical protein BgiBS90_013514 [Biomphalaria glabrata]|nr:hypothetical protein BgiBS90_013514 [Biomphalaria glabrata]
MDRELSEAQLVGQESLRINIQLDTQELESSGLEEETSGVNEGEYETDPKRAWTKCLKNPGHKNFIPFKHFSVTDLPQQYQHQDIFNLIKYLGNLVVKINVAVTSTSRPKYKENKLYPFYTNKGLIMERYGSGRVWDVQKFGEGDNRLCQCKQCQRSSSPFKCWGEVNIVTATHVVFDNLEGQFAECWWNYSHKDSKYTRLEGIGVVNSNIDTDLCYFRCVTHDVQLVDRLKIGIDKYNEQCEVVYQNFTKNLGTNAKLVAIVSHPHGNYRHVSVGECNQVSKTPSGETWYSYNTCTCPGSSGAPVYHLGKEKVRWSNHPHSGTDMPVNYSGVCWN